MENKDKKKFIDNKGVPLTQSLFLELGYNTEFAVYTLKDYDYMYKNKLYPSIKRLYLEHEDAIEYEFASEYFLGWRHWQRLCGNKQVAVHIEEWREELELKIRSSSLRSIMDMSLEEKGFQAAKWLADKGWDKKGPGRPSKEEQYKKDKIRDKAFNEYSSDANRMLKRVK